MGVVQLGGVHGVGKTTTIEQAAPLCQKEVPVLKGSVIMARILGVSTEELPFVSPKEREIARAAMFEELATTTNGIRDGHYCVFTAGGGYEFPFNPRDRGVVDVAVLLVASAETVLQRRQLIERERPKDLGLIQQHLELEQTAGVHLAQQLDVPLIVIHNEDGDHAPKLLAEVLDDYLD